MLLPIIMAVGSGTRLWPLSQEKLPKQFLSISSQDSMLQETIGRLKNIEHLPPIVICNEEHRFLASTQLQDKNIFASEIILEPVGKNTAPAICIAALLAVKTHDDPIMLVMSSDHFIKDNTSFINSITAAIPSARDNKLVIFGITPNSPETGYGYIKKGDKLCNEIYKVDSFIEKPTIDIAENLVASKEYLWNSGIFLFKASTYLSELKKYRPDILISCEKSIENAKRDLEFLRLDSFYFNSCPSESIDYAVMEKTDSSVVMPIDIGWSDIGTWSSLWKISNKNVDGNVFKGNTISLDVHNCFFFSKKNTITAIGINNLIVVDANDSILICDMNRDQEIKSILPDLNIQNNTNANIIMPVHQPWGKHENISKSSNYQLEKVIVNPKSKSSEQIHHHRAEHWIIVSGTAHIYKNGELHILHENESIFIPKGVKHYFENPGLVPLIFIEVKTGSAITESDIVRIPK